MRLKEHWTVAWSRNILLLIVIAIVMVGLIFLGHILIFGTWSMRLVILTVFLLALTVIAAEGAFDPNE